MWIERLAELPAPIKMLAFPVLVLFTALLFSWALLFDEEFKKSLMEDLE